MADVMDVDVANRMNPKKQVMDERFLRRLDGYRRHHNNSEPRFSKAFSGHAEQNYEQTMILKQKYLETKGKRQKKTEKKQTENSMPNNLHPVPKFRTKRSASDDLDGENNAYAGGPPPKSQPPAPPVSNSQENLTKFSVEIVQQLEFTTTTTNSQISTNVTVKAFNTSVKCDGQTPSSSPGANKPNNPQSPILSTSAAPSDVECKQEPEHSEFVDLEECAAALAKDAVNGGSSFPGFPDLIGDESGDNMIPPDAFKDLISEISCIPSDIFDFEETKLNLDSQQSQQFKVEDSNLPTDVHSKNNQQSQHKQLPQHCKPPTSTTPTMLQQNNVFDHHTQQSAQQQQPIQQQKLQQQQSQQNQQHSSINVQQQQRMQFQSSLPELRPAAQTLKQMAEHHQHKTQQMGLNYNQSNRSNMNSAVKSPYAEYQFNNTNNPDFINNSVNNQSSYKQNMVPTPTGPFIDNIKQEFSPGSKQTPPRPSLSTPPYKQQYSPYSSPGHGSPQYSNRAPAGAASVPPPRPPSCPSSTTLQINQSQQLHISQSQGQSIQMMSQQQQQIGIRPPPPEYKVSPNQSGPGPLNSHNNPGVPSGLLNQRFGPAIPQQQQHQQQQQQHQQQQPPQQQQQRRVVQQPMPPSGPMMRPNVGFMNMPNPHMTAQRMPFAQRPQRMPTPEMMSPEWRQMMHHQQQQQHQQQQHQQQQYHQQQQHQHQQQQQQQQQHQQHQQQQRHQQFRAAFRQTQGVAFSSGNDNTQMIVGQMQQMQQRSAMVPHHQIMANQMMSVNLQMHQSMNNSSLPNNNNMMSQQPGSYNMNQQRQQNSLSISQNNAYSSNNCLSNQNSMSVFTSANDMNYAQQNMANNSAPNLIPNEFNLDFLDQTDGPQLTDSEIFSTLDLQNIQNIQDIL